MGALLGYMAQRVLGQYDLLVPDDRGEAVYYVGANVLSLEKRFAFRPRDFRLWIAIHEVTHRAQFVGVPWMREYFMSLVQQVFELVDPDPRTLARALSNAVDAIKRGENPLDEGGLVSLIASPEQRGVLGQVQALMSLLEGHGNVVMTDLGARHVAGEERMARVLHQRRQTGGIAQQIQKLLGLEQKMRQYEVGEKFVRGVLDLGGPRAIDHAWEGPENLPVRRRARRPGRVVGARAEAPRRSLKPRSVRLLRWPECWWSTSRVRASRPGAPRWRPPGTASPSRRTDADQPAVPEPHPGRDRAVGAVRRVRRVGLHGAVACGRG